MSLKDRIRTYLYRNPQWISGAEIEKLSMQVGKKASNASRRLRELHEAGILERRFVGGHVEYRYRLSPVITSDYFAPKENKKVIQKEPQVVTQGSLTI